MDFFRIRWSMLLFKYIFFIFFCSQCCNLHGRTFLNNIFFQKKLTFPSTLFKFKNIVYKHFFIIEKKNTKKDVFALNFRFVRFRKRLLKTTSTISFSNQNDEPETRRFVFHFKQTKTKQQNVVFSIVFKNAVQQL